MDTYENHSSFNRHLAIDGFRVSNGATKPSVYITEVKMRRAIKELSDMDIEELFDNEMNQIAIKSKREKLIAKIDRLLHWQLMTALNILLKDGNFDAIKYVLKCKRSDKEFN